MSEFYISFCNHADICCYIYVSNGSWIKRNVLDALNLYFHTMC